MTRTRLHHWVEVALIALVLTLAGAVADFLIRQISPGLLANLHGFVAVTLPRDLSRLSPWEIARAYEAELAKPLPLPAPPAAPRPWTKQHLALAQLAALDPSCAGPLPPTPGQCRAKADEARAAFRQQSDYAHSPSGRAAEEQWRDYDSALHDRQMAPQWGRPMGALFTVVGDVIAGNSVWVKLFALAEIAVGAYVALGLLLAGWDVFARTAPKPAQYLGNPILLWVATIIALPFATVVCATLAGVVSLAVLRAVLWLLGGAIAGLAAMGGSLLLVLDYFSRVFEVEYHGLLRFAARSVVRRMV